MSEEKFHKCKWPGCETIVPDRLWGCKAHWYAIPKLLRNKIVDAETIRNPGRAAQTYTSVACEIQAWIDKNG